MVLPRGYTVLHLKDLNQYQLPNTSASMRCSSHILHVEQAAGSMPPESSALLLI